MTSTATPVRRRSMLALCGATLSGGCVGKYQSLVGRDETAQLSLRIKTLPADADAVATRIARRLATHLTQVGVDATVVPLARDELLRSVLLNHDFDVYVSRFPVPADPDALRPLLHSRFAPARGWANPFGYAELDVDDRLERQARQSGTARAETLDSVQARVVRDQPFTVLAAPDGIRTARRDSVAWSSEPLHTVGSYLSADPRSDRAGVVPWRPPTGTATPGGGATPDGDGTPEPTPRTATPTGTASGSPTESTPAPESAATELRMSLGDARPTENLNPLSTPFRRAGVFVRLVYDALGRRVDGAVRPWLAESWSWTRDADGRAVSVRLRPGLTWHDGEALTAADVAFTYRFLADTSLGAADEPVPSPSYHGRASLVESVAVESDRRLSIEFGDVSRPVAARALTVPVLPQHVWTAYSAPADIAGIDAGPTTEALVHANRDPVGSGPLRVTGVTKRESVRLAPNPDHFLVDVDAGDGDDHLAPFAGGFAFDRLTFVVVPSDGAAVDLAAADRIDASATGLAHGAIHAIGETGALELRLGAPRWWYHVGYNLRRPPFTNPRFRRVLARLLDRERVVDSLFDGYATPALTPLATTPHAAADLEWPPRSDPLPFAGRDGELDTRRVRGLFREAGYTYRKDGSLVVQR